MVRLHDDLLHIGRQLFLLFSGELPDVDRFSIFNDNMCFLIHGNWFSKTAALLLIVMGTIGQSAFAAILKLPS